MSNSGKNAITTRQRKVGTLSISVFFIITAFLSSCRGFVGRGHAQGRCKSAVQRGTENTSTSRRSWQSEDTPTAATSKGNLSHASCFTVLQSYRFASTASADDLGRQQKLRWPPSQAAEYVFYHCDTPKGMGTQLFGLIQHWTGKDLGEFLTRLYLGRKKTTSYGITYESKYVRRPQWVGGLDDSKQGVPALLELLSWSIPSSIVLQPQEMMRCVEFFLLREHTWPSSESGGDVLERDTFASRGYSAGIATILATIRRSRFDLVSADMKLKTQVSSPNFSVNDVLAMLHLPEYDSQQAQVIATQLFEFYAHLNLQWTSKEKVFFVQSMAQRGWEAAAIVEFLSSIDVVVVADDVDEALLAGSGTMDTAAPEAIASQVGESNCNEWRTTSTPYNMLFQHQSRKSMGHRLKRFHDLFGLTNKNTHRLTNSAASKLHELEDATELEAADATMSRQPLMELSFSGAPGLISACREELGTRPRSSMANEDGRQTHSTAPVENAVETPTFQSEEKLVTMDIETLPKLQQKRKDRHRCRIGFIIRQWRPYQQVLSFRRNKISVVRKATFPDSTRHFRLVLADAGVEVIRQILLGSSATSQADEVFLPSSFGTGSTRRADSLVRDRSLVRRWKTYHALVVYARTKRTIVRKILFPDTTTQMPSVIMDSKNPMIRIFLFPDSSPPDTDYALPERDTMSVLFNRFVFQSCNSSIGQRWKRLQDVVIFRARRRNPTSIHAMLFPEKASPTSLVFLDASVPSIKRTLIPTTTSTPPSDLAALFPPFPEFDKLYETKLESSSRVTP